MKGANSTLKAVIATLMEEVFSSETADETLDGRESLKKGKKDQDAR